MHEPEPKQPIDLDDPEFRSALAWAFGIFPVALFLQTCHAMMEAKEHGFGEVIIVIEKGIEAWVKRTEGDRPKGDWLELWKKLKKP